MKKKTKILTFIFISALLILAGGFTSCNEQEPPIEPFLRIDKTEIAAAAEGGTFTIAVSSNGEWTAVVQDAENNSWLTLANALGANDGMITVSIAENPDFEPRTAKIQISIGDLREVVVVCQEAADESEPFLEIDKTTITVAAEGGTFSIAVSSNGEWTAIVQDAENHLWLTLDNASGVNDGVITVNIAESTLSETRSATIKISMGSLNEVVVVEQEEAEMIFPREIPFEEFSLAGSSCGWKRILPMFPFISEVIVINNLEDLEKYILCAEESFPEIDFSKYTLLLAHGVEGHLVRPNSTSLQQLSVQEFTMQVDLTPFAAPSVTWWHVPIIINKIPDNSIVELIVTYGGRIRD